ncbi:MAG: hypothetical protein AAF560_22730 [Acidobacteriota bacterium]
MKRCALVAGYTSSAAELASRLPEVDLVMALTSEDELMLSALALEPEAPRRISPFDLISTAEFQEISWAGLRARDRFVATLCRGEQLDGIDWPALFLEDNFLFFFRDLLFAQRLGERLRARGIDRIVWETGADGSTGRDFRLGLAGVDGLEVVETERAGPRVGWKRFADPLIRLIRRVRKPAVEIPASCGVVAVFSTRQWERFRSSLIDLRQSLGDQLHLWYLGNAGKDLIAWCRDQNIPVLSVRHPTRVDPDIQQFFRSHQQRWFDQTRFQLAEEIRCPALARDALRPPLELLWSYTLPRTAQWGRDLRGMLETSRPRLVIGTAAFTYQTALPYHVANSLDLSSVALSHTYVSGDHSPVPSTYLACRNRFERNGYRRTFPNDERVLYCRNASDSLSYQPDAPSLTPSDSRPLVAMLTASSTLGVHLLPMVDTGELDRTLRALANPPEELSGVDFAFKSHPRFDISQPLQHCVGSPNVRVLPATASVTELLEAAWLVVVFNHYGGVVIDAAMAGKPILFLDSAGYFYPHVKTQGFESGTVVDSVEAFWELLTQLVRDHDLYTTLQRKCRRFAERYLEPADADLGPSLAQLAS